MNRITPVIKRILVAAAATLAIAYLCDYASVRMRMRKPSANDPFEVLTIRQVLKISHKGGFAEDGGFDLIPQDPQNQTCVHALFPHSGYDPCWYVSRQNGKTVTLVIVPNFYSLARAFKR